jgi:Fungal Zn(2)-Cys(6) binuclear cluster domain
MNTTSIQRTAQDSPQKPAEQQVNRACEACRLLKVRCLPDGTSDSAICQRCKKSGRICIYAAPQKRRQRIRTDTRVAELEREIRAMRSLLTGGDEPIADTIRGEGLTVVTVSQDPATPVDADTSTISSYSEERSSGDGKNCSRQSSIPSPHSTTPDDGMSSLNLQPSLTEARRSKDFGLLSPETSNQLFESYNNDLVQHYPAVIFPKHTSPEHMRKSKPVLFQAVVTAAACQLDSVLFGELFKEMTKVYAERIFINGEKSLELIQSLILTSIWYCPPDESCGLANLHFYQYIHMAATMALDLGIGLAVDKSVVSLDECRSLLVCYLNCAGYDLV